MSPVKKTRFGFVLGSFWVRFGVRFGLVSCFLDVLSVVGPTTTSMAFDSFVFETVFVDDRCTFDGY